MKKKNIVEVKPANNLATLKWYGVRQNNSGGYIIQNDEVGSDIFVQCENAQEATRKLEQIVENYSEYCSCCGERWLIWIDESDGYPEPTKYSVPISEEYRTLPLTGYAVCYFYDGRVIKYYNDRYKENSGIKFIEEGENEKFIGKDKN